jgi:hypothetical protein
MVEQKMSPDQEQTPETEAPPTTGKDDRVQKQLKLIAAGNRDVSEKLKRRSSPEHEKDSPVRDVQSPREITSPKLGPREVTSPVRTTPLKAPTEEKLSPVRPSHLFTFSPAAGGAQPALKAEVLVPGGRLFTSKEEPIRASPERDLSKPIRRTSSLRDRVRPTKFSSDTSSSGPDEELSRILSRRKGTIEKQIDIKLQSPKLENLDTKWSSRNAQHIVNSDDNIQDEQLKTVLKNRRARSESGEREIQPEVVKPAEAVHPILKPEIPDSEKEPVPILRKKSPDEKHSTVKIQAPLPILRRKSLEGVTAPELVEPVPILRVKSLDAEDDTEEPVSILKHKEDLVTAESVETLHSILKRKDEDEDGKRPSILKRRDFGEVEEVSWNDHRPSSILKKRDSADNTSSATSSPMRSRRSSGEDTKPASILKKRESEEFERRSSEPEIRMTSILKKRDSGDSEKVDSANSSRRGSCEEIWPISILKKRDSMSGDELEIQDGSEDMKPILKRRDRSQSPAEHPSVLSPCRNLDDIDDPPRTGILKRPSLEELEAVEHPELHSIMKHKDDAQQMPAEPTHIFRKRPEKESESATLNLPEYLSQISDMSSKSDSATTPRGRSSSLTDRHISKVAVATKIGEAGLGKSFDSTSYGFQLHVADYSPAAKKQSGCALQQRAQTFDSKELSEALKLRRTDDSDSDSEEAPSSPLNLSAAEEIKMIRYVEVTFVITVAIDLVVGTYVKCYNGKPFH